MSVLNVTGVDGNTLSRCDFPSRRTSVLVDGVKHPTVWRAVSRAGGIAVDPRTESGVGITTDGRCDENRITPDDWA